MLKTHKTKKGLVTEVAVAMSGSENSPSWIGREVYPEDPQVWDWDQRFQNWADRRKWWEPGASDFQSWRRLDDNKVPV